MAKKKERLDKLLVDRGLVSTRSRAKGLIRSIDCFLLVEDSHGLVFHKHFSTGLNGQSQGTDQVPNVLNEVYVVSKIPGRLLTMQIFLDDVRIDYGRADGAMLATPSGSTAYALAAGGSILAPDVNGLIFVPVCPPRFELKSIVIPDQSTLEIELVKKEVSGLAVIDGQTRWDIEPHDKVWLKKSDAATKFIRLYDNYYDRLNTRLIPRTL